jgi:hypothetical protein
MLAHAIAGIGTARIQLRRCHILEWSETMKLTYAIAALLAAATGGSSIAQTTTAKPTAPAAPPIRGTAPPRSDASCILVANVFATQTTNADQKTLAQNVLFFYFGRLDARASEGQMKAELRQARTAKLTTDTAAALMNSCAQGMQARAKVFEDVMQQLQQGK